MLDRSSTRRSDEELAAILDEPCEWKLTGRRGAVLGFADCLRDAMRMACEGRGVIAIAREPDSAIIVFAMQFQNFGQKAAV
jgi:hypothetical protein